MYSTMKCVQGTIHQGSECLPPLARGRQCGFIAVAAAVFNNSRSVKTWTETELDSVLKFGSHLYLKSLKSGVIPDSGSLLVSQLPVVAEALG